MAVNIKKGTVALQLPVTPMVDLVFNLLLFFIMATTFATEEHQLKLMLPAASEAMPMTARPRETVINIDQEGRYFLTGGAVSLAALQDALDAASTNNPGRASAIIRADERCNWKFVVAAMNACTKAKVFDVHVMTRQSSK